MNAVITTPEVEGLYRDHSAQLRRVVRFSIRASEATVEDACQSAWARLVGHRERVQAAAALAWVERTAVREAARLVSRERRTPSHDRLIEEDAGGEVGPRAPSVEAQVMHRLRLESIGELPLRQRRLLWLAGLGFEYSEMAAREGCTWRTVDRQLVRGRRALRERATAAAV
jgi:RNA polymerase sigma factor (sigma-70 family)